MIILLSDTLRIRSTELNWQLERPKGEKWKAFSYHRTLASALLEAAEREIRLEPCEGLGEAIAAFRRVGQRYSDILDDALGSLERRAG